MKKQLTLIKENEDYILLEATNNENKVIVKNKTIDGEKIYTSFYSDIVDEIEICIRTELTDHKDKIIFNQLNALFHKVDEEVNKVLKPKAESS